ncbi:MAG: sulfotransferase [Pleurocapsa sp.]
MKNVFIIALPRSGTSWLQGMLGLLPEIATVRETHLVDNYLRHLVKSWNNEQKEASPDGLSAILSEAEFYASLKVFSDRILNKFLDLKPNAEIILEKTPDNLNFVPLLHRLYPQAYFIHLIRDPRAVVASHLALKKERWGWVNANQNHRDLALKWCGGIEKSDRARDLLQDRFLEISYEDLKSDRNSTLLKITTFLELSYNQDELARLIPQASAIDLDNNKASFPTHNPFFDTRPNFFRRGEIDSWQQELTQEEILDIESICLRLMSSRRYKTT